MTQNLLIPANKLFPDYPGSGLFCREDQIKREDMSNFHHFRMADGNGHGDRLPPRPRMPQGRCCGRGHNWELTCPNEGEFYFSIVVHPTDTSRNISVIIVIRCGQS